MKVNVLARVQMSSTVMPQPASIERAVGGVTAKARLPSRCAILSRERGECASASAATAVELVQNAAKDMLANLEKGVTKDTLTYLRVRLPPLRNSSIPTIVPATVAVGDTVIEISDFDAGTDAASLFGIDESHVLTISAKGQCPLQPKHGWARLSAADALAAFHLVRRGARMARAKSPISVSDAPRFEWRGLMIDTARHYLPVKSILRTIEGLAALKNERSHWHIVDSQSFPFMSSVHSKLSGAGALHPELVYSATDIKSVIQYGLARGVRIVPEFDVLGHSASWGFDIPSW